MHVDRISKYTVKDYNFNSQDTNAHLKLLMYMYVNLVLAFIDLQSIDVCNGR